MSTVIRSVKTSDWEKLKNLLIELVHEKPPVALELEPLIMKGVQWIEQFPRGKLGHFIIMESSDEIIGFCYVAVPTYYKPIGYIGIGIKKECRKKSLGSQMFYEVAQWAVKEQVQYLVADIWNWNLKSIKFFEHLGFVERQTFKEKFKGEERLKVRMVKAL